jgi:hypothetical protein
VIRRIAQQMFADLIDDEVRRRTADRIRQAAEYETSLRARIEDLEGDLVTARAALERRDPEMLRERLGEANLAVEVERERADRLYEDLAKLRNGDAQTARLTTDERRELHLLREQVKALHERAHKLTIASMEADFAGVTR